MTDMPVAPFIAAEGCEACGLDPCGCPETEAAIAAAPAPDFGPEPETGATMPFPAEEGAGLTGDMHAAGYEAAMAFLARRAALEAEHEDKACCHRSRPELCALIDAGGRIDTIKGLLNGRPDRAHLERAALHLATIGAMLTTLHETVSAELAGRPGEGRG